MQALPKVRYTGRIREITFGKPGSEMVVGGETGYNFYSFEGVMPNPPRLALQVLDIEPDEWPLEAHAPYADVVGDPVAWARKCIEEFGADLVCLWLAGTDPNGRDLSPEHAAETALKVAHGIDTPLIVWGVSSDEKNTATLKAVAEACSGLNLILGPVTETNYKQIGAAAIAYKHVVAANSPIDINLAKQLNILLENLGVPADRILIDPTTGAVGYGMEYCYSIMERIRQAALTQNDEKLQYPIINNIAEEVWKTKEAGLREDDDPTLGNPGVRAVNLEAITAVSVLQAGSDLVILRHPDTLRHVRGYLTNILPDADLESMDVDLSLAAKAEAPPLKTKALAPAPVPKAVPEEAPASAPTEPESPAATAESSAISETAEASAPEAASHLGAESPQREEPVEASSAESVAQEPPTPTTRAGEAIDLTDEDIEALREMIATFRSVRSFIAGLAELARR